MATSFFHTHRHAYWKDFPIPHMEGGESEQVGRAYNNRDGGWWEQKKPSFSGRELSRCEPGVRSNSPLSAIDWGWIGKETVTRRWSAMSVEGVGELRMACQLCSSVVTAVDRGDCDRWTKPVLAG